MKRFVVPCSKCNGLRGTTSATNTWCPCEVCKGVGYKLRNRIGILWEQTCSTKDKCATNNLPLTLLPIS